MFFPPLSFPLSVCVPPPGSPGVAAGRWRSSVSKLAAFFRCGNSCGRSCQRPPATSGFSLSLPLPPWRRLVLSAAGLCPPCSHRSCQRPPGGFNLSPLLASSSPVSEPPAPFSPTSPSLCVSWRGCCHRGPALRPLLSAPASPGLRPRAIPVSTRPHSCCCCRRPPALSLPHYCQRPRPVCHVMSCGREGVSCPVLPMPSSQHHHPVLSCPVSQAMNLAASRHSCQRSCTLAPSRPVLSAPGRELPFPRAPGSARPLPLRAPGLLEEEEERGGGGGRHNIPRARYLAFGRAAATTTWETRACNVGLGLATRSNNNNNTKQKPRRGDKRVAGGRGGKGRGATGAPLVRSFKQEKERRRGVRGRRGEDKARHGIGREEDVPALTA